MADIDSLMILLCGARIWNRWRDSNVSLLPDVTGAHVDEERIGRINIRAMELRGIDFTGMDLSNEDLSETNLDGASLRKASLYQSNLREAILTKVNLEKSDLRETDLREADLREANLVNAGLFKANLGGANLRRADLNGANLVSCQMHRADLALANLSSCFLKETGIQDANLESANLSSANLRDIRLGGTNLTGVNLKDAEMSGANIPDGILVGADLTRSNLSRANLCNANLGASNLTETNLYRANLENCNFRRADLTRAKVEALDLRRTDFGGANLTGAKIAILGLGSIDGMSIDRACLGSPKSVISETIFRENLKWNECHFGTPEQFDPSRDPVESGYWTSRKDGETLFDAALRKLAKDLPNSIHLTFQESVWRDLVVIETGLRELFGEGVETKKTDGALTVSFQSTEDMQRGLDAIFIQLAAKQAQDSQPVSSLVVQGEGENRLALGQEELVRALGLFYEKMESVGEDVAEVRKSLPALEPELTDNQETLAKMTEDIPILKYFSHRFRKWLTRREVRDAGEVPVRGLFQWAREGFSWSQKRAPTLGDSVEDAEILEERAEGRLLGDGRQKE